MSSISPFLSGKKLYLTYNFEDNFLTAKNAVQCHNVALVGKDIKNLPGMVAHSYNGNVKQIVGKMEGVTFLLTTQGVGGLVGSTYTHYYNMDTDKLAFCTHRNVAVFSSSAVGTFVKENDIDEVSVASQRGYDSIASVGERVWAVQGRLLYGTNLATDVDWDKGFVVTLPTLCNHVAVWDNKLYVFGEDVYQLQPDSQEENLSIQKVGSYGNVLATANSLHNGKLYFATAKGLYVITGSGAQQVAQFVDNVANVQLTCNSASVFVNLIFPDKTSSVLEYSIATDSFVSNRLCQAQNIFFDDCLWIVQNNALATCNSNYSYSEITLDTPLPVPGKSYYLRNLYVKTEEDLQITLLTDVDSKRYSLQGQAGIQALPLCGKCKQLSILLCGKTKLKVSHLALEVTSYEI